MVTKATVIIHDEVMRAKLLAAAPNILAQNRVLVAAVIEPVKPAVEAATPIGPGHFGYHGRDTVKIEIHSVGVRTWGQVRAAMQLYWREYGTGLRFRGPGRSALKQAVRVMTGGATGGEPAFLPAHKALSATKRFISFYYNGMANWWRL